jgi:uncharacterized protein YfaS (alpha-2-macroglobulin family)
MIRWSKMLAAALPGCLAAILALSTPVLADTLDYRRLEIDTAKPQAEACLVFSEPLKPQSQSEIESFFELTPSAKPAARIDKDRLCLAGLDFGVEYTMTLRRGLPAASGALLVEETSVPVQLRERAPLLSFRDGLILPGESARGVPITTINIPRVAIEVLRVPDRLASQIQPQRLLQRQGYPYELEQLRTQQATSLWKGELETAGRANETVTTLFPLRQAVPQRKPGIYVIVAENAADRRAAATSDDDEDHYDYRPKAIQWVVETDIGLTSFSGADGLHIFARSLASAKPIAGIQIAVVARDNEELARGVSDADGHIRFDPGLLRGQGGAAPATVMAYGEAGDFNLHDINKPAFDLTDRGVAGRALPGPVDAFLYTERGIYRPGETVELAGLLRDRLVDAMPATPVTLSLLRPDGVEYRRATVTSQEAGGFRWPVELTNTAPHGHWKIDALLDPKTPPVGHVEFDVEDFVPQLLAVDLAENETILHPATKLAASAAVRFLYGAPGADLHGESDLRIFADPNPFPEQRGFHFGLAEESFKESTSSLEIADTDENGHTDITGDIPPPSETSLPLRAEIRVAIFEPGGRTTESRLDLPLATRPVALGIHPLFEGGRIAEDGSAGFEIIALDETGKRIAREDLQVQLVREIVRYDWYAVSNGGWRFEPTTRDRPVDDVILSVAADQPITYSHNLEWGYYRLIVRDKESGAASSYRFSAGWRGASSESRPDRAEIAADKESYHPGETAHLAVKAPGAGEGLLVIASDRILATRLVHIAAEGATIEVPVTPEWGVGAYAVLTQYRPLAGNASERQPVRSVGVAWLPIDTADRKLVVKLDLPDRIKPRQTIKIPVTVAGATTAPAYLTLAAVDQGILQLTRFRSPAPSEHYLGKRRLAVDIRDDYARLIEANGTVGAIRSGGDAGGGRALEVVPTKTVALFSGIVATDAAGHAEISFDIPDFNGELRLMAVAFDARRIGEAEARLTVRDPVVAEVVLPRFLAPGDDSRLNLSLHNLDGSAGAYHVRFTPTGAVSMPQEKERDVDLAAGQRLQFALPLAGETAGVGTIALDLSGPGDLAIHREWQIAVRLPQLPVTSETLIALKPGKETLVGADILDGYVEGTTSVSVGVASWRGLNVPGLLRALDRYPYGCIEQTTSRALPLLYFNDVAMLGGKQRDRRIEDRVQEAIYRILDMQRPTGEFGMWSSASYDAEPWLGVYALDFLSRAREKGYSVPEDALRRGRAWMQTLLRDPKASGREYAAYVLARLGGIGIAELRYLFDNEASDRDALATAQLGTALTLVGDAARGHAAYQGVMQSQLLTDKIVYRAAYGWHGDYYASPLRNWAGILALAAEAKETSLVPRLLNQYERFEKNPEEATTQEKAWLLLASWELQRNRGRLAVSVDGTRIDGAADPVQLTPGLAELQRGYKIRNLGDRDLWQTVSVEGVPRENLPASNDGVELERSFFTLDGQPADLSAVRQNDRLVVLLAGNFADHDRHDVALLDLLPAGFEIEAAVTPDEKGESGYDFLPKLRNARTRELRDDRYFAAFTAGYSGYRRYYYSDDADALQNSPEFNFAYIVRAITPGTYVLPAATVEDMYKPSIKARTEMGSVTVLPRQ